ncbi:MAG: hypothetical protein EON93_03335 [Burkholderiales bacterium]|nr:MAG: hypothetical protein EON93_03335 [Burkholderiales bacterium]
MRSAFRRLFLSRSGSMALYATGLMLAATLIVGGVVDYISLITQKQQVQSAADRAALAAAREMQIATKDDERLAVVARLIAKGALDNLDGVEVTARRLESGNAIEVSVTSAPRTFFPGIIGMNAGPVRAQSVAEISGSAVCMIGLEVKTKSTLFMQKKAAITARNCAIYSNSRNKEGITVQGDARITADFICSAGGVKVDKKLALSPAPLTDCPTVNDPLASRPPPSYGSCDFTKYKLPKNTSQPLAPGVYCGGLEIEGTAKLKEGVYVIKDGPLRVKNKGILIGKHVGFFLTGKDALINFEKDTKIELVGPRNGALAGLLFYEDRNVVAADGTTTIELDPEGLPKPKEHRIRSDDARELVGTIYIPRNRLLVDGDKPIASESAYTVIVAREFVLAEGPEIVLNADYEISDVPVPEGVGNNSKKSARLIR